MADKEQNTPISTKNTKQQILDAYNDVCKQLEKKQAANPQKEQKKADDANVIARATSHSNETIIQDVAALKVNINQSLNALGEQLTSEYKKLEDITNAIALEQKHLEELYEIKDTANTLAALICTQDETKRDFERKVQERRNELEKEGAERREYWQKEKETKDQSRISRKFLTRHLDP